MRIWIRLSPPSCSREVVRVKYFGVTPQWKSVRKGKKMEETIEAVRNSFSVIVVGFSQALCSAEKYSVCCPIEEPAATDRRQPLTTWLGCLKN